jgi:hypothetical protein
MDEERTILFIATHFSIQYRIRSKLFCAGVELYLRIFQDFLFLYSMPYFNFVLNESVMWSFGYFPIHRVARNDNFGI